MPKCKICGGELETKGADLCVMCWQIQYWFGYMPFKGLIYFHKRIDKLIDKETTK